MNSTYDIAILELFKGSFWQLPKASVKIFGLAKATILAYFVDLERFALANGSDCFFCKVDKISADLGLDRRTIMKSIAFFESVGIFKATQSGGLNRTKHYKIDNIKLCEFVKMSGTFDSYKNDTPQSSKNDTFDSYKNDTPQSSKNDTFDSYKNDTIYNNKESTITKSTITNSAERFLPKKEVKKSKIDLAKDFFLENSHKITNNHFDLDLWIKWIAYKIKKTRKFDIESFEFQFKKLLECESRAREAVEYSIGQGYQGLFLPNGNAKPQKYQYDPRKGNTGQSDFSDNPDDYINENMAGVKKIGDGVFEADLFVLTGRKESKNDDIQ